MADGTFWDDSFDLDRSWGDAGTTISEIWGTHQNSNKGQDAALIVVLELRHIDQKYLENHEK